MWYINQNIVCVDDSRNVPLVRNKEYVIKDIVSCLCGCGATLLDVGLNGDNTLMHCLITNKVLDYHTTQWFFLSNRFAPLLTDSIEFAEETLERIKTNIEIEIEEPILN
jgi:hypothetical protein